MSARQIFIYFLPVWLLLLGIVLLLVSAPPILRRKSLKANRAKFKSLRVASPVLNALVMISVVGKPFLENLKKNDWETSFFAPQIETPLVWVFIISLYALLAAVLFFFFRAIRNINVLSGQRLRSPYSALFMLVPISNLIVIPYLEYFVYQRSRALATPERASKLLAALLVGAAFALLVVSVALGLPSDDPARPGVYDPLDLLVLTLCTSCASGILTTRVINGIFKAQDTLAQQIIPGQVTEGAATGHGERIEMLKLNVVAVLLVVAFVTAVFPSLPSRIAGDFF